MNSIRREIRNLVLPENLLLKKTSMFFVQFDKKLDKFDMRHANIWAIDKVSRRISLIIADLDIPVESISDSNKRNVYKLAQFIANSIEITVEEDTVRSFTFFTINFIFVEETGFHHEARSTGLDFVGFPLGLHFNRISKESG